jgi:regulator of sigma E protease
MTQALQLLLSLSILIVLHELGHFIPAKLFKTKVEKFYLFFDPWFSLFKVKRGETEYGIGWLPLGGYVKIAGMIDESMDKEQMKQPPQPWEFRSKPAWQRLIIMVGGVTVNVILGVLIYAMVLFAWGKEYLPNENATHGVACDSLALKIGLRDGDKILSVDNQYVTSINKVPAVIILDQAKTIQVERDGQKLEFPITEEDLGMMLGSKKSFITPRFPSVVDSLIAGMNAEKSGLQKGDKIIAINDTPTPYHNDVQKSLFLNKSKAATITVLRGTDTSTITCNVPAEGGIGFYPQNLDKFLTIKKESFGFVESIPAGMREGWEKIEMQVKTFSVMFSVSGAHKSLGGFYSIAQAYSPEWDWQSFWTFTAFLSIVLAFMNLLPIPALDGGHVVFLLYEMVTRRKPNEKFMEYAQYAGMFLLLALMVYANTDWLRR